MYIVHVEFRVLIHMWSICLCAPNINISRLNSQISILTATPPPFCPPPIVARSVYCGPIHQLRGGVKKIVVSITNCAK